MSPRQIKKKSSDPGFIFTDDDQRILEATAGDLTTFSEWYFNASPIKWQHWFHHRPQKRKTLVAGIRSGKTFGISLGFPHFALFHPHSRIANASISADQAKIVYYNVLELISNGRFSRFVEHTALHPYPIIELINGSQMWFRSTGYEAELWRGQEFDWINIDEAAYVTSKVTYDTLQGRLLGHNTFLNEPRHDILTMTTSPKGRGWLYDEFKKGLPNFPEVYNPNRYLSLRVRTSDNPHLNPETLAELTADYSDRQRQQELEGAFLDPDDAVFAWEAIRWMSDLDRPEVIALTTRIDDLSMTPNSDGFAPKVLDKHDYARYQLPPEPGHSYITSWDLGTSATTHLGRNATVGMVIDITNRPWQLVAYRREKRANYSLILQWVKEWHNHYRYMGRCANETVLDATGSGNAVQQILQDEHNLDIDGLVYTTSSKPDIIAAGQVCLERGWIVAPPIRALTDELSSYEIADKKIVQDTVMALCQGLQRARARDIGTYHENEDVILATRTGREIDEEALERYREKRLQSRGVRSRRGRSEQKKKKEDLIIWTPR